MLEYLRIRNLALIDDMELEFSQGLNVLTGETGAGKSFILKAINFLTGDKLETDLVRPGQEKASAEALFSLEDGDYVLKRELNAATGRSRLFVNDSLSSQEAVRSLRPRLIIHASQHGQQQLMKPAHQARLLDSFLKDPSPLAEKIELTQRIRDIQAQKKELEERSQGLAEKRDFLEFQHAEIEKVSPKPGEEDELEARRRELRDSEQARQSLENALNILNAPDGGLLDAMSRLERDIAAAARAVPDFEADSQALAEAEIMLRDLDSRLRRGNIWENGQDSLERIEARLYELAQLKRKLKRSLEDITNLRQEIEENLSFLDSCGLDLKRLEKEEAGLVNDLAKTLERLNQARKEAGAELTAALERELKGLGFSEHVKVECLFTPAEIIPGRPELVEERARFMWSPNPGQPAQPLDKIASGGELSRFLLAVVGLAAQEESPSLIFDEVDAGVGGVTLGHVGQRLKNLSQRQQVILISHWPQLASLAERHFMVRKDFHDDQTFTRCVRLSESEIFEELSRMAGGGDQGKAMARELL